MRRIEITIPFDRFLFVTLFTYCLSQHTSIKHCTRFGVYLLILPNYSVEFYNYNANYVQIQCEGSYTVN